MIIVTLPINAWLIFSAFKPQSRPPRGLAKFYERLEAFRIVNGYGLFRVMTKDRGEIVIEGSSDGIEWLPYEFKWKPGDVKTRSRLVRAAPAETRLADVVCRFGNAARKSVVSRVD